MKNHELIRSIKASKGIIYAGVLAADTVYYVAAVKSDLITVLSAGAPELESGLSLRHDADNACYYLDSTH